MGASSPNAQFLLSGQPSASCTPSRSSGMFGQRSSMSGMPSRSLSGSGHPSPSSNPSKSSGSSGQRSVESEIPSPSRSPPNRRANGAQPPPIASDTSANAAQLLMEASYHDDTRA